MVKLVGRLIRRLVGPSLTDKPLGLLLHLLLFCLNPLLVHLLAGDGGLVLMEEAMVVKVFGQVLNNHLRDGPLEVLLLSGRPPFLLWDQLPLYWYFLSLLAKPKLNKMSKYRLCKISSNDSSVERRQASRQRYATPCVILIFAFNSQKREEENMLWIVCQRTAAKQRPKGQEKRYQVSQTADNRNQTN